MSRLRLTLLLLLLWNTGAEAHLLKLFAYVEGQEIHGSAYFAGGAAATGAPVTVTGADGQTLATLPTDPQGAFRYHADSAGDYRLRVDTGDGHQAEWLIRAAEFGQAVPETAIAATPPSAPQSPAGSVADARLAALIEQALARQIGPLREALQRSDERARLSDILGGIGFIFGLAGIALWWRGRQGGPKS
jgi:nickel transport protein